MLPQVYVKRFWADPGHIIPVHKFANKNKKDKVVKNPNNAFLAATRNYSVDMADG